MINFSNWIQKAINEDIGAGDFSALACIPLSFKGKAKLLVKQKGIIAGVEIAKKIFEEFEPSFIVEIIIPDGTEVKVGDIVLTVEGPSQKILSIERLVLNVMQRMSGIATYTHFLQSKIAHTPCKLLDTRKTTPLFRFFEKEAVKIGGAMNHRMGLYDMIMLKDNHIDFAGGIDLAVKKTKKYLADNQLNLKIEVEVRNLNELQQVLNCTGVFRVMLDNFTPNLLQEAVKMVNGKIETEASGGITEETIIEYAETGVNYISVGALTHQIKSLDLSLKAV
jgi:nicotinate-nucleotide pyrophosphorylase (carboxylating)